MSSCLRRNAGKRAWLNGGLHAEGRGWVRIGGRGAGITQQGASGPLEGRRRRRPRPVVAYARTYAAPPQHKAVFSRRCARCFRPWRFQKGLSRTLFDPFTHIPLYSPTRLPSLLPPYFSFFQHPLDGVLPPSSSSYPLFSTTCSTARLCMLIHTETIPG